MGDQDQCSKIILFIQVHGYKNLDVHGQPSQYVEVYQYGNFGSNRYPIYLHQIILISNAVLEYITSILHRLVY